MAGADTIVSPTKEELEAGKNWDVVHSGDKKVYVNHKLIPFGRIITRG